MSYGEKLLHYLHSTNMIYSKDLSASDQIGKTKKLNILQFISSNVNSF